MTYVRYFRFSRCCCCWMGALVLALLGVPLNAVNLPVLVHYLVVLTGLQLSLSPIARGNLHVLCLSAVH